MVLFKNGLLTCRQTAFARHQAQGVAQAAYLHARHALLRHVPAVLVRDCTGAHVQCLNARHALLKHDNAWASGGMSRCVDQPHQTFWHE
eukprot:771285-Pelagomonas_calceolata.AAC.1